MVFFARAVRPDKSDGNSASLVKLFIASTEGPKNQYLANHRICMCEKHRLRVSFYFAQVDSKFMIIRSNEKGDAKSIPATPTNCSIIQSLFHLLTR